MLNDFFGTVTMQNDTFTYFSTAPLEGDFCSRVKVSVNGFKNHHHYTLYSGVYLAMINESTNHGE